MLVRLILLGSLTLGLAGSSNESPTQAAAKDFLAILTPEQRSKAVLPSDSAQKTSWMYVPGDRPGISWKEMTDPQTAAAKRLLRAALGEEGYVKGETIRSLETVLAELENNPGRDPSRYWFVFFGSPSPQEPWVWRYEGHHLSLTFGLKDGKIASSTPQFVGSNPAEVRSGSRTGLRVLAKEQDLAYKVLESLTPAQAGKVILSNVASPEILTTNSRKAIIEGREGIPFSELTKAQQGILMDLIQAHASIQSKEEQKRRLTAIKSEDSTKLVFAWLGPKEKGRGHYYRIQGEKVLIEYDNTQSNANHIHTVWRNLEEDFGGDPLAEHLSHHQH